MLGSLASPSIRPEGWSGPGSTAPCGHGALLLLASGDAWSVAPPLFIAALSDDSAA
jgi:hypothetical protein